MQAQDYGLKGRGSSFVDRLRELAELRAGMDEALANRGRLFMIAGEPGIGKSRLADEAANYGVASGAIALWGRCWEGGGAPAYWPWIQVVRGLTSRSDPPALAKWMDTGAIEIAQIIPELRSLFPDLPESRNLSLAEPEQARFRLFDSIVSFLRRAAETRPLVIVLDDLHAADPTSLLMLMALARDLRGARLMVIGTYREVETRNSPERAQFISEVEREGVCLPLRGLGEAEIGQFIEVAAGVSPAPSLISLLCQRTEGNPFFLSDILRLLAAEGQLESDVPLEPRQLRIPDGVRESIKRRTAPLSHDAREILAIASVIGREFDLTCLERAVEVSRETLAECLDAAARLDLITQAEGTPGRYSFRHALIRETLYESFTAKRRVELHRLVGDAIRATYPPGLRCPELAYHYCEAAAAGNEEIAVQYSRQAAQLAQEQLAYEEASRYLSMALEVLRFAPTENEPLRTELLLELGEAQNKSGDPIDARKTCLQAADLARRLKRPELFARAVVAAGRRTSDSGTTDSSLVALFTEALDLLGELDSPLRAQVLARFGVELYWSEREKGVALCQHAVEMAKRLNDQHTLIITLWARHLSLRNPNSLEQRLADTDEVIKTAESTGEKDFALEVRYYRIADLLECGDVARADMEQRLYLIAEAELRDRFKRGILLEGMRALLDGRFREAETLAQQAFAAGQQSRRPVTLHSFLIQMGYILWERGKLGDFESSLRTFISQYPPIVFARCALVSSMLQAGRDADARLELEALAADDFSVVPRDWNWLPAMFVLAESCVDLADINHAATLYRLLTPYSARNAVLGYVCCYGSVSYVLGRLAAVLGRAADAEAHFNTALAANQRIRASAWVAHTQCEYAAFLLSQGAARDRIKAMDLISSAERTAQALEMVVLQERVRLVAAQGAFIKPELSPSSSPKQQIAGKEAKAPLEGRLTMSAPGAHPPKSDDSRQGSIEAVAAAAISEPRDLSAHAALDGTVTILFSDIEDSSPMFERLGDLRAQEIVRIHNEIFRQHIAAHKGYEVKSFGDGFMIAFSSARRAVLCSIAIQRALTTYCDRHPDQPIRVRMGLHVGETISESADFFGKAVILAARIASLASGGQILVSSTLRDLTASAGDLRFAEEREVQLKGLSGTHRVYRVVW